MKKRLSLLLATLMVISMLPMSAFAAGTQNVTVQNVTTENKNQSMFVAFDFTKTSSVRKLAAQNLRLELTNGAKFTKTGEEYNDITLGWTGTGDPAPATVKPVNDTTVFLKLTSPLLINADDDTNLGAKAAFTLSFKVNFESAKDGDVNLVVVDNTTPNVGAHEDTVGNQTVKLAVVKVADTSDLAIEVKDKEKAVSFDGGKLSQFEIKNFKKVDDNKELVIALDDSSYSFVTADTKVYVDGADATQNPNKATVTARNITIPKEKLANAKSIIVMPVLDKMGRRASTGDVEINVDVMDNNNKSVVSNSAVIGKVVDYNVKMTIVELNKKEIPSVWGGEKAKIKVTLEGPKGSIDTRAIDFKLEGAKVLGVNASIDKASFSAFDSNRPGRDLDKDGFFKGGEFSVENSSDSKLEFVLEIHTDGDRDGVATLTAAQRGWEAQADAAKVTPKFTMKTEEMPVKKGEARDAANIVITEAKAGLLSKSDKLTLTFETRRNYTQFVNKDIKVEATNGMKFGDVEWKEVDLSKEDANAKFTQLIVPITKVSKGEPAVITISGIKVLVDGSSTDDVIKVNAGISGVKVDSENYIKVVKEYALESITTVFTIGQTQYTKNGQAMTVASAPYIKNGRTMLPIRAVAESLGLTVQWNGSTKTATFSDATKVAAVTIGAEKMFVNGTPVPLAAKAELVNGTTFVELRSLSTAFGVQIDWDAAAKTATVSK